jgi:hypothetical protein
MIHFLVQYWQFLLFGGVVGVLVVVAMLALRDSLPPYERRGILLTPAGINFFRTLQLAAREDWLIFSMVRLADVIKVRPRTRKSFVWNSRIQGKHLDFVICDYETLEVKLAIELDDPSLPKSQRRARDNFVNVALAAAGVPLLRVRVREKYETAAVRKDIEDALGIVRKKKRA